MQHASPEAYEAEAARFRQLADTCKDRGNLVQARLYRGMAEDCDNRAQALRDNI